ncbi:methyltransferase [Actinophytocola oryzae]|uniref:Cyclopropane fatty-acyl-phospholipid synthase-like methyltransferase n=1 Tax=Actinophytocola oryzae TaxID=502181 RepID=A0A4R7V471_9PSEU|nr:methyltransferase [Actinophytocola oryzae]TDV42276.1 cyclopropane fatty-acyl-phospholipid synthase-like methyltransferase [Actinophytocola oryzae]
MTSTLPNQAEKIRDRAALIEVIGGYMASQALRLAAELKIADLIHDGVDTSAALAQATGSHEPSLHRLLRMLAAVGITTEPEPGRFGLSAVGEQLRSDSPDSLWAFTRFFTDPSLFTSWQSVGHTVRTGECAFDQVHGKNAYVHLSEQPELSALFNHAMSQESRIAAGQVAAGIDFTDVKSVVDIGGGDGTLLKAILTTHPHLTGVVFDSPSGVAEAPKVIAEAGLTDRCEVVAGDFFQAVPEGGDLYIIKSVFQDWDDEPAAKLLRTVRAHMPDGAKLLIVGSVLTDTATTDEPVMFLTDANMLVTAGGRERTESEFAALLADTGFTVEVVARNAAGPLSVIEALPA